MHPIPIIWILGLDVSGVGENSKLGYGTLASCREGMRLYDMFLQTKRPVGNIPVLQPIIAAFPGWSKKHLVYQNQRIYEEIGDRTHLPPELRPEEYTTWGEACEFSKYLAITRDRCKIQVVATRKFHSLRAKVLLWYHLDPYMRRRVKIVLGRPRAFEAKALFYEIRAWGHDILRMFLEKFTKWRGPLIRPED